VEEIIEGDTERVPNEQLSCELDFRCGDPV
jgi:hypothetical protein